MTAPLTPGFGDGTPYPVIPPGTSTVSVSGQSALDNALSAATAGQKLVLAAGSYTDLTVPSGKSGTASAGISIEAAAGATVTFSGRLSIDDAAYLTLKGLTFNSDPEGELAQARGSSHHIKFHRCTFGPATHPGSATTGENGNYLFIGDDCKNIVASYCEFRNKSRGGNGFRVYGNFDTSQVCQYILVDHCDFHDFYPALVNDFEPIRLGVSSMSQSNMYAHVIRCVFTSCRSEPEVVSMKANRILTYGSTFDKCAGGPVIRHGQFSAIGDCYIIDGASTKNENNEGSGGPRFYDADNAVIHCLMQGLSGTSYQAALQLDGGESGTSLSRHVAIQRAFVHHNIIAECATPITVKAHYSIAPSTSRVEDNIVAASGTTAIQYLQSSTAAGTGTVLRNDWFATATAAGLAKNSQGVYTKAGYGPRVSMLRRSNVGPANDLLEQDGLGSGPITGGGGSGGGFTADLYVSTSGSDSNSGLTSSQPKRTILAALNIASAGQTISVAPGTYDGNVVTTKGGSSSGGFITIRSATKWGAKINGSGSTSNQTAVEINHSYIRIQDFEITGTSTVRNGVIVNNNNIEILNNHIHHTCQFLTGGTSWQGGAGIDIWGSATRSNVVLDGNYIHHIGLTTSTQQLVHGIYLAQPGSNSIVRNNVIHNCEDYGIQPYPQDEAVSWVIVNNTVSKCGRGIRTGNNTVVRNNISYNNKASNFDVRGSGSTLSNNLSGGTGNVSISGVTGGVDPLFVSASGDDYRLQSGSPAIDAGTSTNAPTTDHLGATRPFGAAIDIGAYEFGATVPGSGGGDPENPTPTPFTVDAGADSSVQPGATFARTATETGDGTVATRSWTIVGAPTTTGDPTVAAERYSWGTALAASDELNYSGVPNNLKWDVANGVGWAGNGTRSPARVTVNGSAMVITGLDGTAVTGSVLHTTSQRYGRWEVRCRSSVTGTGGGTGGGTTGSFTGGSGGPQTDRTNVSYTNSAGTSSSGHIYAAGLDWTKTVGVIVYTDGSGEFGLQNPSSTYLLGGANGLIAKAKAHNMILVTPKAPGGGCDDGDGVCWYDKSGSMQIATKIKWCDDFIRDQVLTKYNIDKRRVVLAGYSSGAQWTTEYYGPQYASAWMEDGLLLAISFGGSPKVTANYPASFKQNVAAVWDVGANDPAYDDYPSYDAESGYGWYSSNGFTTTELHVIAGENHSRDGDFGAIVDREVTQHVTPTATIGSSGTGSNDYRVRLVLWPADGIVPAGGQYFFLEAAQGGQTGSSIELHYPSLNAVDSFETTSVSGVNLADWHNFAIEWSSTEIIVWIDGVERVRKSGGATSARRALQDTQGPMKLGIQLDATAPDSLRAAQIEVDWARVYPLVPTGTSAGSVGTVGTVVGTAAALSWTVPTTLGVYTLRYAAFAAGNVLLDDDEVAVTVATSAPPGGGGGGGGGGGSELPILEIVPESILSTEAFGIPAFEIPVATVPVLPTWPDLTLFPGPATYPGASPVEGYVDPRAGIASVRTGWTTYPGPGTFPGLFTFPGWGGPRDIPPFDVEVFLLDDGGKYVCPLPDVVDFDLSQVENAPGSVSFTYATEGANFDLLRAYTDNGMDAQVAIRFAGGTEWEIHAVLYAAESDDVDDEGTWKFSGSWAEALLEEAVLYPEPGVLDGKVTFTNVTPGALMTELISRAQQRGGLEIDTSSFSATFDSRGQDWPEDTISSPTLTPGDSMHYLRVLQLLTEAGLCEFEMRGRRLMLYRPGGRGWDRTKGNQVVLQAGRDLVEVSKQLNTRGVVTSLLVLGKDGDWVEVADDTALGRRRRRVEGASSQTSLSGGSLRAYGRAKLTTSTTVELERTHKLSFAEESPLPMRQFGVGDWLWSDVDGARRRMRVAQWTVSLNSSGLSGTVSLGNLIPDPTLKLARKLLGITDGTGTFGGGTPTQTVQGATPAAPRNVVVDSVTPPAPDGKSISTLLVSWDPVVTAVDGVSGVTITGYRLRWRYVVPASTGNPVPIAGEWTYLNELPNATEVQVDGVEPDVQVEVQVAAFSDVTTTETPTTPTDPGTGTPGQAVPIPFNSGGGGVPPQTQAAELILARLNSGQAIQENWTWSGAPGVVLQYAAALLAEADAAGVDET